MSDTRPHDELDLEALARGDRVAADVLVERCRGERDCIFDPDVFAALAALSKARPLARAWEALLAQLRSVHVDVSALKRALSAADDDDDDDGNEGDSQAERLLGIADQCEYFLDEFGTPYMSFEHSLPEGGARLETTRIESRRGRRFFVKEYVSKFRKPPTDTALRGVLEAVASKTAFSDEIRPVFIRRARHNGYLPRSRNQGRVRVRDR